MPQGFVYILVSPNSKYIKIGGTKKPISERIGDINSSVSYGGHGPWSLSDFLHVKDWQQVEGGLHRHFKRKRIEILVEQNMGVGVRAQCEYCGYATEILVGYGMAGQNFGYIPVLCRRCRAVGTANQKRGPLVCTKCQSKDVIAYDEKYWADPPGEAGSLCPKCGKQVLQFSPTDLLWD